ncbi:glycosyl transferase family 1 [Metallibacterium sp.]|uniref:glycosyl transferase family 1 n=1 Tax=Metallibacterium sp. TaxID=2940281 RepID=UPI0026275811|nr:glycosyl transferase family 1 [Metallibacterium sp.]
MRVNVIAWDNGLGLSRHLRLLAGALRASGHDVTMTGLRRSNWRKLERRIKLGTRNVWNHALGDRGWARHDVNLLIEHIRPEFLPTARRNVLLPHPEWFLDSDRALLPRIDAVFAQTQHAVAIFERLGQRVLYTGFTSEDRRDVSVPRERAFFHLAGRSQNKGSERLLALWCKHPEWPCLTVIQNPKSATPCTPAANIEHHIDYLDDAALQRLQNAHWFHLCPSETEGYGHYLVEAMGIGAVVLTTDAAPMNEFITATRGLRVACTRSGRQNLATTHYFDDAAMEQTIAQALALSDADLARLGGAARVWFEDNARAFPQRVDTALQALSR